MPVTRRALLGLGAGGLAATVAGCSGSDHGPEPEPYCTSQLKLARHSSLRTAKFVYDPDRQPTSFSFDRGFYGQLGTWLED